MRAVRLDEGLLSLASDQPTPDPPPGEALIRVTTAGICNTDLELVRGYYPFRGVLGHEFVGRVETGPDEWIGRRVVGEINAVCGECPTCLAGRRTHCERRTVLGIVGRDGAFADFVSLPVENLHPVPDDLADETAVFVEPLAAALEIQEQLPIGRDHRVVVVGDGKLGQLIAASLSLTGCDLFVVGRHTRKLEILGSLGIETGSAPPHQRFDVAVDCTGAAAGFEVARQALRPRGTLVMKSTYAGELTFDASALVVDEITLIGSRCGPFAPALELLADGSIDVAPLIDGSYALDDGLEAFEHAQRRGTLKILLDMG